MTAGVLMLQLTIYPGLLWMIMLSVSSFTIAYRSVYHGPICGDGEDDQLWLVLCV